MYCMQDCTKNEKGTRNVLHYFVCSILINDYRYSLLVHVVQMHRKVCKCTSWMMVRSVKFFYVVSCDIGIFWYVCYLYIPGLYVSAWVRWWCRKLYKRRNASRVGSVVIFLFFLWVLSNWIFFCHQFFLSAIFTVCKYFYTLFFQETSRIWATVNIILLKENVSFWTGLIL